MAVALKPAYASEGETGERSSIMREIPPNTEALVLSFKWIDFLLHRIKRERLQQLMGYYQELGWIGDRAKTSLLTMARGTLQDVGSFQLEEDVHGGTGTQDDLVFQNLREYRLSAADHIRSLMFIKKIMGEDVDSLELGRWEAEFHRMIEM